MNFKAIDSHCHLQAAAYAADRDTVMSRMAHAKVAAITVGTNFLSSSEAVTLAEAHKNIWASVAVHPGHVYDPHHDEMELAAAPREELFDENNFSRLLNSPRVVAIGETGLDYYRLPGDENVANVVKKRQRDNFIAHISAAKKKKLPLILHVREAQSDALAILEGEKYFNGVMHCFTGTITEAERFLEKGFFISFTGALTYPPKKGQADNPLHAVLRMVPLERLLVETDAPWLTPAPLRGKRNEPTNVLIIAEKIAEIRRDAVENILQKTMNNASHLFNLASPRTP